MKTIIEPFKIKTVEHFDSILSKFQAYDLEGKGETPQFDPTAFASLTAADFSANDQLARMIGRPVINAGLPGDTTAGALARLEQDVLARSPRIVLITIGGNDLTHGVDREVFSRNLQTIVTRIQAAGALVVVGGAPRDPAAPSRGRVVV